MSIQELPKLMPEKLQLTAADNFNSLLLVTLEYLNQHQLSIQDYVDYVGKRFASQWGLNKTPLQVAEGLAINFISVGAKVVELAGDENQSYFVMTGWPPADVFLRYSGKEAEADEFVEICRPIAERQICSFAMERQDDRVICKFHHKAK
jgi:hypothetical protein